jgi:hypothetical protein
MFCVSAYGQDVALNFVIPDAKVATALAGFLKIYPNIETIPDPEWVDPEDGSEAPRIPKYATDKAWVEEKIRRMIVRDIRRGLQITANQAAVVAQDDGIVTIP